jgi:hypothetical protein
MEGAVEESKLSRSSDLWNPLSSAASADSRRATSIYGEPEAGTSAEAHRVQGEASRLKLEIRVGAIDCLLCASTALTE